MNILLVEDNELNMEIVEFIHTECGGGCDKGMEWPGSP